MLLGQLLFVSGRQMFRILIDRSFLIFSHFLNLKHYSDMRTVNIIIIIIIVIIIIIITTIKVLSQQPIER